MWIKKNSVDKKIKIERTKKKGEKLASCSVTTHHPYEFTILG